MQRCRSGDCLRRILHIEAIDLDPAESVLRAIAWAEQGLDFAGVLHLALSQVHTELLTFDAPIINKAAKFKPASRCRVVKA